MNDRRKRPELEQDELTIDRLLASIPREPLPIGFRDDVLAQIASGRSVAWEWIVAAALALPSLVYVAWQLATHGEDFIGALGDLALATQNAEIAGSAFFVDGLVVLAMALLGMASVFAAHALITARSGSSRAERVALTR